MAYFMMDYQEQEGRKLRKFALESKKCPTPFTDSN